MSLERDPERERLLPLRQQKLVEQYARAWSASGRAGRIRWQNVYDALASGEDGVEEELLALIEELRALIPRARAQRRKDREDERWEAQALELDSWLSPQEQQRRYAGQDVWMYHGTSSSLVGILLEHGLQPDVDERAFENATPGYVYLTTKSTGEGKGDSSFYARRAAAIFGGRPVVLRVIVPFDDLEPDEDDSDLSCGRHQFRTTNPVPRIMEVGGRRVHRQ